VRLKELGWFNYNIHLTPAGGMGIGDGVSQSVSNKPPSP
jgi:hypothetical protein